MDSFHRIPLPHLIGSDHTNARKTRQRPLAFVIGHVQTLSPGGIGFALLRRGTEQHHAGTPGLFRKGLKGRQQFQRHPPHLVQVALLRDRAIAQHILQPHQKKVYTWFPAHCRQRRIEQFLKKLVVSPKGNLRLAHSQGRQPKSQVFLQRFQGKRPGHSDLQRWGWGNGIIH